MTLLREKDQIADKAKANETELQEANKEVKRLEKLLKESEKKRVGLQLLGELKAIKVRNSEARIKVLEANREIDTPHDLAKQLQRALNSDRANRISPTLKHFLKEELKSVLSSVELLKANKVVTGIVNSLLNFSQDITIENKRTAGEVRGTRKRLNHSIDIMDKLQSTTQGHIPTMIVRTLWKVMHRELERLKHMCSISKDTDTDNLSVEDEQNYKGLRIPVIFPEENLPFLHQRSFPDPKAYTPCIGLQDMPLLDTLTSKENSNLVSKIMTNDRLIRVLLQAIEGNLCETGPAPSTTAKRTFRINRTIVGKSTDTRDRSISGAMEDRAFNREKPSQQESFGIKYNASDSTRRSGNNSLTYGRLDMAGSDEITAVRRTFSTYDPPSIALTTGRTLNESYASPSLITPPASTTNKAPRSRILRDAKALSSKFNKTLRDYESISDGVYLLVDSEMAKKKRGLKKR